MDHPKQPALARIRDSIVGIEPPSGCRAEVAETPDALIDVVRYGFVIHEAVDGRGHAELIPRDRFGATRTETSPPQQVVKYRVEMRHESLSETMAGDLEGNPGGSRLFVELDLSPPQRV